ncbi:MAG: DUF1415 family protein [Myxococcota bacterium]
MRPTDAIKALHARYLEEVVEALQLCPFARRARLDGRVVRMWFDPDTDDVAPEAIARALAARVTAHATDEIILPTFVVSQDHMWQDFRTFDKFRQAMHAAFDASEAPTFHMVSFHPSLVRADRDALNAQTLVPLLRRTPDPVVQCVRASVLDALNHEANERARAERLVEIEASGWGHLLTGSMRDAILHGEIENRLAKTISERNFSATAATPEGWARLNARLEELCMARRALE